MLRLQKQIGNAATTRLIQAQRPSTIQRHPLSGSIGERLDEAIRTEDVSDIKDVPLWALSYATVDERVSFIDALVHQGWVGPIDEVYLERLWDSFGRSLATIGEQNIGLWNLSIEKGMDPSNVRAIDQLRQRFERDVKSVARNYMEQNKRFAETEMERLGIRTARGVPSPTQEIEQELHLGQTQELAQAAAGLLDAKRRLSEIHVGYRSRPTGKGPSIVSRVYFDPNEQPMRTEPGSYGFQDDPPITRTWEQVKEQWDATDAALAGIAAQSPTVFAVLAQDEGAAERIASGTPEQARASAGQVLNTLHGNIMATLPKIDSGDLDWRDLKPIHEQMYAGSAKGSSGTDWSNPFTKTVGEDVIGDHESSEFWISLGLGTAAAALFVVANIATGGLATAALLGGMAVGAGTAVRSWENYEDLATAAGSTASEETRLVSEGQVDAAMLQAILDTVFAFLDIAAPAVRAGRAALGAARLEAELLERGAAAALERLGTLEAAEAAQAVQRGIVELGVEGTMRRTGKSAEELAAMLRGRPGMEASIARLEEAGRLGLSGADEAAEAAARVTGAAAEEAWKGSRSLGDLVGDVGRAVQEGTVSRAFADRLIAEAVERLGPSETLRRAGGWRRLSQLLGAESSAGAHLMAWRNAVFEDLERYVREVLEGEVQRTGTVTNFTNDIDMSFVGANSSSVRNGAMEYLAGRLGVGNSPREFEQLMMAGLFTDPRRMHIYDILPQAIRDMMARRQAGKEQALIWNRRLWEATEAGDDVLASTIREQMGTHGVVEFNYRPLTSSDVARLAERIDGLHAELNAAVQGLDVAAQERLARQIADSQALIAAAEGGGYFSGGGVRRFVSERPGQPGFARPAEAVGQAAPSAERLTAILDQLPKLDHSVLQLSGTSDDVLAGVRGIGKYGERLVEVSAEAGVHQDAGWRSLLERCQGLKRGADFGETAERLANSEADAVIREARQMFDEIIERSNSVLSDVRAAENIPEIGNAAARLQYMTTAHVRLLRAADWALANLNILARTVRAINSYYGEETEAEAEPAAAGTPAE